MYQKLLTTRFSLTGREMCLSHFTLALLQSLNNPHCLVPPTIKSKVKSCQSVSSSQTNKHIQLLGIKPYYVIVMAPTWKMHILGHQPKGRRLFVPPSCVHSVKKVGRMTSTAFPFHGYCYVHRVHNIQYIKVHRTVL